MRPETKAKYPSKWSEISKATIEARGSYCEACGRSRGNPYPILTVHHIDYDPSNNDPANLVVLCQGCHLRRQGKELAEATHYHNMELLMRMGQSCFPGLEPVKPKNLPPYSKGFPPDPLS